MFIRIAKFIERASLVQRFSIAGFIIMILGTVAIGQWAGEKIKTSIINETAATTALYLDNFITPNLQELSRSDSITPEHFNNLNHILQGTNLGREIVTIKVWNSDNRVLYSTSSALIGRVFPIADDLILARQGHVVSDISNLQDSENGEERRLYTSLLEIYVPIRLVGTHKIIAVAEFYAKVASLEAEIAKAQKQSWIAISIGMAAIYLLLIWFFQQAGNRIKRQDTALKNHVAQLTEVLSQNNELDLRVRRATANTATLNESFLRRISVELHSGPIQEISLGLLRLDQALSENEVCRLVNLISKCNDNLPAVQTSLQTALEEVRGIATGLGLPQLDSLTLFETLARAAHTHELHTSTKVTLNMSNLPEHVILPIKITAYRLIQEGLNNAYRHAGGIGQEVQATYEMDQIKIVISDQGPGFNTTRPIEWSEHLGLAGMQERVKSLGGLFTVESEINQGTRITASIPLQNSREISYA